VQVGDIADNIKWQRLLSAGDGRRSAMHQWILFMKTASLDVTPKTTEQNLTVRIGKSEVEVTDNKRLRSRHCTVEANYWQTRSIARPPHESRATCSTLPCYGEKQSYIIQISVSGHTMCLWFQQHRRWCHRSVGVDFVMAQTAIQDLISFPTSTSEQVAWEN